MATPSSSGTSPSPALSFALPTSASENSTDEPNDQEQQEREERRKKLIARTELAKITRALRTTLALASYKAKHNVTTVPLSTLEARVAQRNHYPNSAPSGQATPTFIPATFGNDKKRKSTSTANTTVFYSSPLSQGTGGYNVATVGLGTNAASSSVSTAAPISSYTFPPPSPGMTSTLTNPSKSLFASILTLPPAKRARTIHNPEAPPVPPPSPPPPPQTRRSPKKGATKKGKEPAGGGKGRATADKKGKGKGKEKEKKSVPGRARANSISSVHTHSSFSADTENVNDTDMKAAATLTDLLFSRTGGTASPRSSFSAPTSASRTSHVGPTTGAQSLSHTSSGSSVAPSAATQYRSHVRTASNASSTSVSTTHVEGASPVDGRLDTRRSVTPTVTPRLATRTAGGSLSAQATQVFGAPGTSADSEAADLMLLLANSPSPARPTAPRDQDISRNAYAAGRVLFPLGPGGSGQASDTGGGPSRGVKRSLGASSISSIDTIEGVRENGKGGASEVATSPPSSSQGEVSPPQVPKSAVGASTSDHSAGDATPSSSRPSQLLPSPPSIGQAGPQTPVPPFRLTDYINVTPSPAAHPPPAAASSQQPIPSSSLLYPSTLGTGTGPSGRYNSTVAVSSPLRKSFDPEGRASLPSRRLFEAEPGGPGGGGNLGSSGNNTERKIHFNESGDRAGSLGAGIDLVQT